MIDHFTKYAEAATCMTALAEETCDHLINVWIARLPHHIPIGQRQSIRGRSHEGVNEEGRRWHRHTRPLITHKRMA